MSKGGNTVPSITNAEHIGPEDTGDNIEAKRVAVYNWNGSAWVRSSSSSGGTNYAVAVDDYTTANVIYVGKAAIGSVSTDATWQIKKVDANTGAIINWADGNDNFDNVWGTTFTSGDVASLTYS